VTQRLLPWSLLLLRVALGIVFVAHGGQKLFGLWGGAGLEATMHTFERNMGIPSFLTLMVGVAEFFGGLAVFAGLVTRFASGALAGVMVGAIFLAHLKHGFFINWELLRGKGHGIEFDVTLLAVALALVLSGPGRISLDRLLKIERADEP